MTDPQLALRAEQALIGALLTDPGRIRDPLNGTDFLKHPTHQAVALEIKAASIYPGALDDPARLIDRIATRLDLPGVDADYLHGLARACPEPGGIAIYARMVAEAQVRRTLAAHADRIDVPETGPGQDSGPDHLHRLAQALRRQAELEPDISERSNPAPEPYANTAIAAPIAEPQTLTRAQQEELILADVLQHRGRVAEIEWLSPEVFAPGPRREIYETIITVDSYGEPISELTVEWELDRRRNEARQQDQPEPDRNDPATSATYVASLAVTAVAVGAAVELGSRLFEDSLRISLAAEAAKMLASGAEPAPATEATATVKLQAMPATQPGPIAQSSAPLLAPPPTPAVTDNQPDIRP
ncbi:DnaB-like helicase N-terminal domain-containing protein [Catenulispora rubra]|uniref:DnaB-like helicase N-terminal domain-containing protein n=1 Tax=Catenulispora rubra TaxID=280293 RepID=UPI0018928305|nr:DnaB-like helicase N-terminal domain-containing protein [Catenulispora rubra]